MHTMANTTDSPLPATSLCETKFSNHKLLVDANELPDTEFHYSGQSHFVSLSRSEGVTARQNEDIGIQQENTARTIPYRLTAGLSIRTNVLPLTTILEQSSCSTFHSHRSSPNLDMPCSLRPERVTSSTDFLREGSRYLNKDIFNTVLEDSPKREQNQGPVAAMKDKLGPKAQETLYPANDDILFTNPPQASTAQTRDLSFETYKAELDNSHCYASPDTQMASTISFRPSSTTSISTVKFQEDEQDMINSQAKIPFQAFRPDQTDNMNLDHVALNKNLCLGDISVPTSETQPNAWNDIWTSKISSSSYIQSPLQNDSTSHIQSEINPTLAPLSLLTPIVISPHAWPFPVGLVQSELCVVMNSHDRQGNSLLLMQSTSNIPVHQTINSANESYTNDASTIPNTCTEGSTRSVSRCSTSYSGTVIGVDLDLCRDSAESVCHPHLPQSIALEEFAQRMPGSWRQRSLMQLDGLEEASSATSTCFSITSSALTSLLQVAKASGIVQPNFNTPKISFYSPSGNLIQPEDGLIPSEEPPKHKESSSTMIFNYGKASGNQKVRSETVCLPAARPSLMPLTTFPNPLAPLPARIKHHHNYRKPEKSQITSYETVFESSPVQGCGGIVRSKNSIAHNELPQSDPKSDSSKRFKEVQSVRSRLSVLKSSVVIHYDRICTMTAPFHSAHGKAKKGQKPNALDVDYHTYSYARCDRSTKKATINNHVEKIHDKKGEGFLGAFAAHALRVCFCQPYDGAGKQTPVVGSGASCFNRRSTTPRADHGNQMLHEAADDLGVRKVHFAGQEKDRPRSSRVMTTKVWDGGGRKGNEFPTRTVIQEC